MRLRSTAGANPLFADAALHPAGGDADAPAPGGLGLLEAGDTRVDPLVTAAFDADDPYVAKVRKVRAKLLATAREASAADGKFRLAILSLQAGDEASILAANVAAVMAQMDGPTILVDADIERPSLDRLLRLPNRIGLAEQLGGMALRLPVLQTAIDRLWLMPAGQAAGGAATLVEKGSLAEAAEGWNLPDANLLAFLAERPRGGTAFGNILEKFDAVVVVARRGVTPVSEIRRVIDDLDRHHIPIAGSVVS
jgi:Mrp family chromosome partitioning ATPase